MLFKVVAVWKSLRTLLKYIVGVSPKYQEAVEQYPDKISSRTTDSLSIKTRGILLNDLRKCTACGDCLKICPTDALELECHSGTKEVSVKKFSIHAGRCVHCSLCIEVCPANSLGYKQTFEAAVFSAQSLVQVFTKDEDSKRAPLSVHEKVQRIRSYEIRR